jgi:hypothetical protein
MVDDAIQKKALNPAGDKYIRSRDRGCSSPPHPEIEVLPLQPSGLVRGTSVRWTRMTLPTGDRRGPRGCGEPATVVPRPPLSTYGRYTRQQGGSPDRLRAPWVRVTIEGPL